MNQRRKEEKYEKGNKSEQGSESSRLLVMWDCCIIIYQKRTGSISLKR